MTQFQLDLLRAINGAPGGLYCYGPAKAGAKRLGRIGLVRNAIGDQSTFFITALGQEELARRVVR